MTTENIEPNIAEFFDEPEPKHVFDDILECLDAENIVAANEEEQARIIANHNDFENRRWKDTYSTIMKTLITRTHWVKLQLDMGLHKDLLKYYGYEHDKKIDFWFVKNHFSCNSSDCEFLKRNNILGAIENLKILHSEVRERTKRRAERANIRIEEIRKGQEELSTRLDALESKMKMLCN